MIVSVVPSAKRKMTKLLRRYPDLPKLIDDVIQMYLENPHNSKLKLHKLKNKDEEWSISLKYDLRLIFVYWEDGILILDVGSHDEVYR